MINMDIEHNDVISFNVMSFDDKGLKIITNIIKFVTYCDLIELLKIEEMKEIWVQNPSMRYEWIKKNKQYINDGGLNSTRQLKQVYDLLLNDIDTIEEYPPLEFDIIDYNDLVKMSEHIKNRDYTIRLIFHIRNNFNEDDLMHFLDGYVAAIQNEMALLLEVDPSEKLMIYLINKGCRPTINNIFQSARFHSYENFILVLKYYIPNDETNLELLMNAIEGNNYSNVKYILKKFDISSMDGYVLLWNTRNSDDEIFHLICEYIINNKDKYNCDDLIWILNKNVEDQITFLDLFDSKKNIIQQYFY